MCSSLPTSRDSPGGSWCCRSGTGASSWPSGSRCRSWGGRDSPPRPAAPPPPAARTAPGGRCPRVPRPHTGWSSRAQGPGGIRFKIRAAKRTIDKVFTITVKGPTRQGPFLLVERHSDLIVSRNWRFLVKPSWKYILSKRPNQYCLFYDYKRCVTSNLSINCKYFCLLFQF